MKRLLLALLLAGCASFDGRSLVPGQSTVAQVEAAMGPAADKRPGAGGETVYYYPRLPWGYATYAARIGPDGRLVALEQRLTRANIEKLKVGVTRGDASPGTATPATSPFTSARKHGTPAFDSCSAMSWSDLVFPVPVAPAMSPCRFIMASGIRAVGSG